MKWKIVIGISLIFAFVLVFLMPATHADGCRKKEEYGWGIESKMFYKAHFILKNQEELKLSDEQITKIKGLKIETKKNLIKQKAEIEIVALDIKAEMWKDTIDVAAINKLIDQKYELKKAKAKFLVEAYAKLKDILTEEQKNKLKGICKTHKKEKGKILQRRNINNE